jgi:hypothetical protein
MFVQSSTLRRETLSDTDNATTPPISFAPQIKTKDDKHWVGNDLRFATEKEANSYANDLAMRWTLVTEQRVITTSDPVNYRWVNGTAEPSK